MATDADRRAYAELVVGAAAGAPPDLRRRLVDAFARVPREAFLGPGPWLVSSPGGLRPTPDADPRHVLHDVLVALAPERGINNGQPSLHAVGIAALAPQPGDTAIHVGAGTGYYTALLAELVQPGGHVVAYEIESDLAGRAARNLAPWPHVQVVCASAVDARLPPADVVYASAGAAYPPPAWLDALREGGRLVFPLTGAHGHGLLLALHKASADVFAARALMPVVFVPCTGAREGEDLAGLAQVLAAWPARAEHSVRRGEPDATAVYSGNGWWLSSAPA
jgi:protein-L-isoaspartate(D-aspartate) O-methyltransferase